MKCDSLFEVREMWWQYVLVTATFFSFVAPCHAADPVDSGKVPIGQFVTVTSPIDDVMLNRISATGQKLQVQATQENRPAILVLQIEPGTSQFHQVQGLVKLLTSSTLSEVITVAWIPNTVTGPNTLVALACKQIVMHPDAELGDIARGGVLEPLEEQAVLAIAQRRNNIKINSAIVRGMMSSKEQLWRVRVRTSHDGQDHLESQVVTKSELETLRNTNVNIEQAEIIKDVGSVGLFKGSTCRALDIVVVQTLENRAAVAAHYGLQRESLRDAAPDAENQKVQLIKMDGIIDRLQENFLLRQIDRAVAAGARTLIFQIDSPGGLLYESTSLAREIANLQDKKIRTIAYVEHEAISGAAIIALGCDEIYLLPEAKIGDAGPIQIRAGQQFERAPEKILSPLKVALRELAEKKHRPTAVCEAMADRLMKVYQVTHREQGRLWYLSEAEIQEANGEWIQGPILRETNGELLLTANGTRAHELKIAEIPVNDLEDLKARIGIPASIKLTPVEKTWVDSLVFVLNYDSVRFLLIVSAVVLLYVELHFMTGILGIMSVLCFALFFWSTLMGGTAGWLEVILFLIGLSCLGLEIFVLPGFGVFGVSGILLVLSSLIMAGHSWSLDTSANLESLTWQMGQVLMAFVVVGVIAISIARVLPSMPGFESMVLGPPGQTESEPQLRLQTSEMNSNLAGARHEIGQRGLSMTILRPAGKARFENELIDVVSEGPFIPAETELQIVSVTGKRIVVRQV